jgi:battenin
VRWSCVVRSSPSPHHPSLTWILPSVNTFYHANQNRAGAPAHAHEFRIGALGLADSAGILLAAVLAVPIETALCAAQVARGKGLCRAL